MMQPKTTVIRQWIWVIAVVLSGLILAILVGGCRQGTSLSPQNNSPISTPSSIPSNAIVQVSYPAPVLGVVVDKDIKVLHVEPGSAAEKAGVQVSDLLETIEDIPIVTNINHAKEIIRESKPDQKLKLKLNRNGNSITVEVAPSPPLPRPKGATPTPVLAPQDYL